MALSGSRLEPVGRLRRLGLARVDRVTAAIWLSGLAIRLVLMPFTAHLDLYHIYSRSADAVYHGQWLEWGSQLVIQMLHNGWFWLIHWLLPHNQSIWSPSAGVMGAGASWGEFRDLFIPYPYLPRALFLMKLPYVASDLATGYVLTRLVAPERRRFVLAFWLLNPLVIYTSAAYGRHDSIAVLMVALSLLLALRERRVAGLALLGLAAVTRFFPAFLAPFYVVAFSRSRREASLLLGGLVAIWGVVEVSALVLTGSSPTLTLLTHYQHIDYLVDLSLPLTLHDSLFLFPAAFTLLTLWFVERRPAGADAYAAAGAAVFLVLFALTFFHPPYAIWLVPFLALTIDRDRKLLVYHGLQIVLIALFAFQWSSEMTVDLLLPLGKGLADGLPNPLLVIAGQVPIALFFGVVRSVFTAVSLWMAYRILRARFGPLTTWRTGDATG